MLYAFTEPALNTFDPNLAARRDGVDGNRIIKRHRVRCMPLRDILARHMPHDIDKIDFMSIDVEGMDVAVLRSNDWSRFRPEVLVVELSGFSIEDAFRSEAAQLLAHVGYGMFAKTANSSFFRCSKNHLSEC
jgi:hypothetical protein